MCFNCTNFFTVINLSVIMNHVKYTEKGWLVPSNFLRCPQFSVPQINDRFMPLIEAV